MPRTPTKRTPPKIRARRSPIHGNGVFAVTDIRKGERLIEYKGRLLSDKRADRLYADDGESGHTFLFTLNDDWIIDANVDGNLARWINHGCAPNCETLIEEDDGGDPKKDRVFIEAIRRIKAGEELTYDYHISLDVPHSKRLKALWACRCGANKCVGTMLRPKRGSRAR